MNRVEVTVTYVDGSTESVVLRPVALVAAERHFAGNVPPYEATLYATFYMLRRPESYADWLESLDGAEEHSAPPTSATPSAPSPN